jgi:voltage-gated potassium channel
MGYRGLLPRGLVLGLSLLVVIVVVGTAGFMWEGLNPVDAIFTTVSAITTVGYSPEHRLSASGKIFATILILAGVGTGLYVLGTLTEFLIEGGLRGSWRKRRIFKQMERLTDHYIISGFGRVGQRVATQMEDSGAPFIVVDRNPEVIAVAAERNLLFLEGDATSDAVLEAVGVKRARGLLACADSDVINVYVTLSAHVLNPDLYIVARAGNTDAEHKLYNAGASRVVSPYTMAGNRMAHLAVQPLAADYVDMVVRGHHLGVQIEERVVMLGSPLTNRSVGDIRRHELSGGQVLAVEHNGELITFVDDQLVLDANDRILVAGTAAQLTQFDLAVR